MNTNPHVSFLLRQFSSFYAIESTSAKHKNGNLDIPAPSSTDQIPLDHIYIHMNGMETLPQEQIKLIDPEILLDKISPKIMGRFHYGFNIKDQKDDILKTQLEGIFATKKPFYKFVIIGGGAHLVYGDALIKNSAYRYLEEYIKQNFPHISFKIDIVDFPFSPPENLYNLKTDHVELTFTPVNWEMLSKYDGIWNLLKIIGTPEFEKYTLIDYFLWLLGIDPTNVPKHKKRNIALIPKHVESDFKHWWRAHITKQADCPPENKTILFTFKASGPLRSIPEKVARKWILRWLKKFPNITLVTIDTIHDLSHPRLIQLGRLPNIHYFNALVGHVEGVVTVESYPQHIADSWSKPCITLSSSIPIELSCPHYPNNTVLMIPGAEKLHYYKKAKRDDNWVKHADSYLNAWKQLKPDSIMAQLLEKINHNNLQPQVYIKEILPHPESTILKEKNCYPSQQWIESSIDICKILSALKIKNNAKILFLLPGEPTIPTWISQNSVSAHIEIIEPRKPYADWISCLLPQNIALNIHSTIPNPQNKKIRVPDLDLMFRNTPEEAGNSAHKHCNWNLSSQLNIKQPDWIIMRPPIDFQNIINLFTPIIQKSKANIIFGPVNHNITLNQHLLDSGYKLYKTAGNNFLLSCNELHEQLLHLIKINTKTRR